jgi:putative oxidoreductase
LIRLAQTETGTAAREYQAADGVRPQLAFQVRLSNVAAGPTRGGCRDASNQEREHNCHVGKDFFHRIWLAAFRASKITTRIRHGNTKKLPNHRGADWACYFPLEGLLESGQIGARLNSRMSMANPDQAHGLSSYPSEELRNPSSSTGLAQLFRPLALPAGLSAGLLLLRLIVGLAFMYHGDGKIQNPSGWMGPNASVPGILQALAAISEFGGGLAWIVGLATPLACFGLGCTMAYATWMHAVMLGDPFVSATGGRSYELALVYLSVAFLLFLAGPGRFSLDKVIFGEKRPAASKAQSG